MKISLKIAICLMTAAATAWVSPAVGEESAPARVKIRSRVLGGPDAMAFDAEATRKQVAMWDYLEEYVPLSHEIQIDKHAGHIPAVAVADEIDILDAAGNSRWGGDALQAGLVELFAAAASDGQLRSDPIDSQLAGNSSLKGHLSLDEMPQHEPLESDRQAALTLIDQLDGIHWPILLIAIGIVAIRMGAWSYLNQALFLATARWEGATVVASSRRGRRRRSSSRSSGSRWTWRNGRSAWAPGVRPSRRRTRQHTQRRDRSRRQSSPRQSAGSARPSYRRGSREYVVSDVVFTTNSAAVSTPTAARPHPQLPLLTYSGS